MDERQRLNPKMISRFDKETVHNFPSAVVTVIHIPDKKLLDLES